MRKHRKTIKLFLIDGDPSGRIACELSNWSGIGYKIPRIKVKDSGDRDELVKPGVYLLFGKNEDNENIIYIGEADPIYSRLKQQVLDREFWNEAIVFVSKDQNLNKAHIKFLENSLYERAKKIKRYIIENTNTPTKSSISEADEAEMEEYKENIFLLTSTLGHKVFDELVESVKISKPETNVFLIKAASGERECNAKGVPTSSGFVVLKDSMIAKITVPGLYITYKKLRDELIKKKIIIPKNGDLVFSTNYEFTSASTAARIVMGRSANGLREWKLQNGKTLKKYELEDK